jgi:DNA-binding transcriptional ArsR family regulator
MTNGEAQSQRGDSHVNGSRSVVAVGPILGALRHPLRREIVRLLSEDGAVRSPAGLSRELNIPLSTVSYHVRVLDGMGLIHLVRTRPVRGSMQHFYALYMPGNELIMKILAEHGEDE